MKIPTVITTLGQRLGVTLTPLREKLGRWWHQRVPREQRILTLLGVVVAIFLLYSLVWQPLATARNEARSRYISARQTYQWMNANSAAIRAAEQGSQSVKNTNKHWVMNINQSAASAGLSLKGFTPQGNEQVRVALEEQPFAKVIGWLAQLHRRIGVVPSSVVITATDAPGRVNVQVTLTATQ